MIDSNQKTFPLFIVGCPRSGTTLLASLLNAHSGVAVMGETHFIPLLTRIGKLHLDQKIPANRMAGLLTKNGRLALSGVSRADVDSFISQSKGDVTVSESLHRLYAWYAKRENAQIAGDKTPSYTLNIEMLARLFPQSRFIHIIRDGRHVAHSIKSKNWGPNTYGGAALFWSQHVKKGRSDGLNLGKGRYTELNYEDLVSDGEDVLKKLCVFLHIEYENTMLAYEGSGADFSRRNFDPAIHSRLGAELKQIDPKIVRSDREAIEGLIGKCLKEFGYTVSRQHDSSLSLKILSKLDCMYAKSPISKGRIMTLLGLRDQ